MTLTESTEMVPHLVDQAAIALVQLSIHHLQLLETMAEELEALTNKRRGPGAYRAGSLGPYAAIAALTE